MKRIAVFFDAPGFDDYPFDKPYYRKAYEEFAEELTERGVEFFVVRSQETYVGNNEFSGGWHYSDGTFERYDEPLLVDLIYNKGYFSPDAAARMVNERDLDALGTDKSLTHALFAHLMPQSIVVHSVEEVDDAFGVIGGSMIVAKPLDGEEGQGVCIDAPENVRSEIATFPYIIQEFLDTSQGIPGIVEGTHDLRILAVAGEPVLSFVRTPPEGSFLANVALGGTKEEVALSDLPEGALQMFREIDAKLEHYPGRIYSVDMARNTDDTWKLIEINAKPGLPPGSLGGGYALFQQKLVTLLLSEATRLQS